ncbi:MAG TPA: peptidylprolyl isomerase [Thermoanaerobaculia bacterium]|nr:peptidylprolyl isomerase [Thermoanaerobaculia bacterium]
MKKDVLLAVVVVAVIAGLTFFLTTTRPNFTPTPSQPFAPKSEAKSATNQRVVMHVNGEPVSETEFAIYMQNMPQEQKAMFATPEGRMKLAEEIVKVKVLEQEGRRIGVEQDKSVQSELALSRTQIVAGNALKKIAGEPDDAKLRAEYAKMKDRYQAVSLSHIVVAYQGSAIPPRGNAQPLPLPQAMQKAQAIRAELRKGANFQQMAAAASDDTGSAGRGGALGEIPLAQLPPEVGGALANLKTGEISEPVRTRFGIHIFVVHSRQTAPFEAVKEDLYNQMRTRLANETIERLRKDAKVTLDGKFFPRTQLEVPDARAPKSQS